MKHMKLKHFFVFDVESIGLRGEAFAVAGGVYDREGRLVGEEFRHSMDPERAAGSLCDVGAALAENRRWVKENIPKMPCTVATGYQLRRVFWLHWKGALKKYPGVVMAAECAWPVEANFLMACMADDPPMNHATAPYPLHEIASFMEAAGMDPMATYERLPSEQPKHDPLADVRQSARLLATALRRLDEGPPRKERLEFAQRCFITGCESAGDDVTYDYALHRWESSLLKADLESECVLPPPGWKCTREAGHEGPCAALPRKGGGE